MEVIRLAGYTEDEKINIANKYLLPKQIKDNGVKEKEMTLSEDIIKEINTAKNIESPPISGMAPSCCLRLHGVSTSPNLTAIGVIANITAYEKPNAKASIINSKIITKTQCLSKYISCL